MAVMPATAVVEYRGRRVSGSVLVDTGARGIFAFIDSSLAAKLQLPLEAKASYSGVGGQQQLGFQTKVDRLYIEENPDCSLTNVPVVVGKLGIAYDFLIGQHFIEQTGMELKYRPDGPPTLACKGGARMAVAVSPIPTEVFIIGGAVVLGVVLILLLKS